MGTTDDADDSGSKRAEIIAKSCELSSGRVWDDAFIVCCSSHVFEKPSILDRGTLVVEGTRILFDKWCVDRVGFREVDSSKH
jgi:hypothetical protein